MELKVPEQLRELGMSEAELLLDLAIGLFVDRRVTLGKGAELVGISKSAFMSELGKRRIPINYDAADLEEDLSTIAALKL